MTDNLVPYLSKLTPDNKAVLVFVMHKCDRPEVSLATLPFVKVTDVRASLELMASGLLPTFPYQERYQTYSRRLLGLFPKEAQHIAEWWMHLSPGKVFKHFGAHPERGKPLNWLPKKKVTAGVKWSLPKRCYIPDNDVDVSPVVAVYLASKEFYKVVAPRLYQLEITNWLVQNCR